MGRASTTLTVKGTKGDDLDLRLPSGSRITQVQVDGLAGSDTLNLSTYGSGVFVNLEGGLAKASSTVADKAFTGLWGNFTLAGATSAKGTIKNVENLVGTNHNDFLFIWIPGTAKFIDGGGGNDVVNSLGGNAFLVGGTGNDWLVGYYSNVTLVGGTWNGVTATPDGQTDYFYTGSQCPVILDFEVGVDKLICELSTGTVADWQNGHWESNGAGGSTLMIDGVAEVTLANVGPLVAQGIELGFAISPINNVLQGSSGDDMLYCSGSTTPMQIILGAGCGDDAVIGFDILTDVLVFEDDVVPLWSDTLVNGAPALLGTWADGSITLQGLGTDDLDTLKIQNVAGDPQTTDPRPSDWSTTSDFPAATAALSADAAADLASLALMAG